MRPTFRPFFAFPKPTVYACLKGLLWLSNQLQANKRKVEIPLFLSTTPNIAIFTPPKTIP